VERVRTTGGLSESSYVLFQFVSFACFVGILLFLYLCDPCHPWFFPLAIFLIGTAPVAADAA